MAATSSWGPYLEAVLSNPINTSDHGRQKPRRATRGGRRTRAASSARFAFIPLEPGQAVGEEDRKTIRRHCMRGRNTKKRNKVYPSAEATDRLENEATKSEAASLEGDDDISIALAYHTFYARPPEREVSGSLARCIPNSAYGPMSSPNDLTLWSFAGYMDDRAQSMMYTFFTTIKESMYPIERCFAFDLSKTCWFRWLCTDAAYFYSVLFTVSAFEDLLAASRAVAAGATMPGKVSFRFSPVTQRYMRQTIALLQKRVENPDEQLNDTTIAVVMTMAMMADAVGDTDTCRTHVQGLKQMVKMRGGKHTFTTNRQMVVKINRIDLGWCIQSDSMPEFADDYTSWEPHLTSDMIGHNTMKVASAEASRPVSNFVRHVVDVKLRNIFVDLQNFASIINQLTHSRRENERLHAEHFKDIMQSLQYRLLLLRYTADDDGPMPIPEALRVGLLAFQTTVFFQMAGTKVRYAALARQLAAAAAALPDTTVALADLKLWVFFIGCISILDDTEPWILEAMRSLTLGDTWVEVQQRLKGVMWIDMVHDRPGKAIFERVSRDPDSPGSAVNMSTLFLGF